MVEALKKCKAANPDVNWVTLTQEQLAQCLNTNGMHGPDLLFRTGGEQRVSNFLLCSAVYAKFYSTDALWPEFDEAEINTALHWYAARERRFSKVEITQAKETT